MDDAETLRKFKASLKAPFHFVPDTKGELVEAFDVKLPVLSRAQRVTFVIGPGRKLLEVDKGSDAIDPSAAIEACPITRPPGH